MTSLLDAFKVNQYFEFHQTQLAQLLLMASYHMDFKVLVWYQDAADSGVLIDGRHFQNLKSEVMSYLVQIEFNSGWFQGSI